MTQYWSKRFVVTVCPRGSMLVFYNQAFHRDERTVLIWEI